MTRIVYFLFYALSLLPFRILYGMADIGYVFLFYKVQKRSGAQKPCHLFSRKEP